MDYPTRLKPVDGLADRLKRQRTTPDRDAEVSSLEVFQTVLLDRLNANCRPIKRTGSANVDGEIRLDKAAYYPSPYPYRH